MAKSPTIKKKLVSNNNLDKAKNVNKIQVLRLLREQAPLSRAELSKLTGLTRPTISSIAEELLEAKLLKETGKGKSSGGKRPIMLSLEDKSFVVIGIDLADENYIRGVVCDLNGKILQREKISYETGLDFQHFFEKLCILLEKFIPSYTSKLKGIGIAVSGIVNEKRNEITFSSNFDLADKKLAKKLEEKFSLPVYLENRPKAAALAECEYGKGIGCKNLAFISTGRGLGCGIISEGSIYRGSNGSSGEIGGLPISAANEKAVYHKSLEHMVSEKLLLDEAEEIKGYRLTYSELLELYHNNDEQIEALLKRNASYLAYGLSMIAGIIDPEMLVLGGRITEFGEKYLHTLKKLVNDNRNTSKQAEIEIHLSDFGRDSMAFGGAALVLDKIFELEIG
jgi:predicted NBD/HSP70 family sugar kinase/DNA-binding XRE family transcriptional regulator